MAKDVLIDLITVVDLNRNDNVPTNNHTRHTVVSLGLLIFVHELP